MLFFEVNVLVVINIWDINDNVLIIENNLMNNLILLENVLEGIFVVQINVSDVDSGMNLNFMFLVVGGNVFIINLIDGIVIIMFEFDYEKVKFYVLNVSV